MTPQDAVGYLAELVIRQAEEEGVPLSQPEKRMLRWSEVMPGMECSPELNEQFEKEIDSDEFETKVAGLFERARPAKDAAGAERWQDAIAALRGQDAYILVMLPGVAAPGSLSSRSGRDIVMLFVWGLIVVVVGMALMFAWAKFSGQ
jgi:hypothetical protein